MRRGLSYSEAGKLGALETAKTAGIRKLKRIETYNNNPKLCKFCNTPISYEKRVNDFCNQSCSAKFYNSERGYSSSEVLDNCLFCNNQITEKGQHKFCSHKCQQEFYWKQTKQNLLSTNIDNSSANRVGKRYLIELNNGKCQICHMDQWCGQQMPLVIDHINGNPYDNSLDNLRVICHNCNALTPTFTGRNKGNGRISRAKRYIEEKKILKQIS